MSKVQFSQQLFEQLGGSNWVARPGYFHADSIAELSSDAVEAEHQNIVDVESVVEPIEEQLVEHKVERVVEPQMSPVETLADSELEPTQQAVTAHAVVEEQAYFAEPVVENAVVLIGSGLDSAWQNEDSLEWQLWQNIMFAFGWDEAQVVFYDTSYLATEDMVFATMEEIIDLSVDWVLTMDAEHALSEQLTEGVQVVEVPDFELMLSDPYAKKAFYQAVVQLNS